MSPSRVAIKQLSALHRRAAVSQRVSSTGCRSKVERLMTLSTSLVAVWYSSDSSRSRVRWRNSPSSRAFSREHPLGSFDDALPGGKFLLVSPPPHPFRFGRRIGPCAQAFSAELTVQRRRPALKTTETVLALARALLAPVRATIYPCWEAPAIPT